MTSKLLPLTATVEVGGESITVREFGFGQIPTVAKHLAAVFSNASIGPSGEINLPQLIAQGGEDVMAILALAAGKPRSWLDTLSVDEGVGLLSAVIAVNKESFAKKLMPALSKLGAAAAGSESN
ncbi:hypothetical protein IS481_14745 [Caldimonas thermodepolymerans]|nr:DUF6631 family protein [Caldimonas thermodepolymerans]QPC30981.1 hypothetical protein IS481_14745 [Caldimonas thermodepolymerans]RDH97005.1 hypothetical protein DES46_10921 [Caldimonas thermodepolymerans]